MKFAKFNNLNKKGRGENGDWSRNNKLKKKKSNYLKGRKIVIKKISSLYLLVKITKKSELRQLRVKMMKK